MLHSLPAEDKDHPILAASIPAVEDREKAMSTAAANAEAVRVQRLREDAKRPMSVNLAETIALSHKLMQFAGSARRSD